MTSQQEGRTLAYCRISLDTERSGSIEKQQERIRAAEVIQGRDPEGIIWFIDRGVSGSRKVIRPGRDGLLSKVNKGDRVVVTKIDRMARNTRDLLDIVSHLKDRGATVRFIDNDINTDGPYGQFMLIILASIAELEASIISERRKESLESFLKQGRHAVGDLPIGLKSIPNPYGRGLIAALDEEKAPLVREAIRRVMDGESQNVVRESLGLSKTGMHKLLHNPRLAGMTPDKGNVVMVNGAPLINKDAQIISLTEWDLLQRFLDKPEKTWKRRSEDYARLIYCGICGDRLYHRVGRKPEYNTYACAKRKHAPDEPGCSVMRDAAHAYIEDYFLREYGNQPWLETVYSDSDTKRTEAILLAEMAIDDIDRRMREASPSERRELAMEQLAAFDALDSAKAIPIEKKVLTRPTGETLADVWKRSDYAERETLLLSFGKFVVQTSRGTVNEGRILPIEERMSFEPIGGKGPGISLKQIPGGLFALRKNIDAN